MNRHRHSTTPPLASSAGRNPLKRVATSLMAVVVAMACLIGTPMAAAAVEASGASIERVAHVSPPAELGGGGLTEDVTAASGVPAGDPIAPIRAGLLVAGIGAMLLALFGFSRALRREQQL